MSGRLSILASALSLCLLTGCAPQRAASRAAAQIPELYASAAGFSARVETTVNRGLSENDFTLLWESDGTESVIEIAAPESVAGIRAVFQDNDKSLQYENAVLALPDAVSPLELLPILSMTWQNPGAEYEAAADSVTLISCETRDDRVFELRTRFDAQSLLPLESAVFSEGERIALYRFTLFSFR